MLGTLKFAAWMGITAMAGGTAAIDAPLVKEHELQRLGLASYWEAHLPLARHETVKEAFLVDDALYVTTEGGNIFALQAEVGLIRWAANLTEREYTIYKPGHVMAAEGVPLVVIPTTARLYIIDYFGGRIVESFQPDFPPGGAVVGLGNALFMGGANARFYSFVWDWAGILEPLRRWEVDVGSPVMTAPLLYDDEFIVFATQAGRVFSCTVADKVYSWSFAAAGPILGDPAIDGTGVYVASMDRSVYKLDLRSGWLLWRARFPAPLSEGPTVAGHTVFQYCPRDGVTALDADTGRESWREPAGRLLAAHDGERDVLYTGDRRLLIVDHETGRALGAVDAGGSMAAVPNGRTDAVYLLSGDGRVLCVRPLEHPYLRPKEMTAARLQLNSPPDEQAVAPEPLSAEAGQTAPPGREDPFRSKQDVSP